MTESQNKKPLSLSLGGVKVLYGNLLFIGFLALLGVMYIYNVHSVEGKLRKARVLRKEVKELKWNYMEVSKEMTYKGMESQVAQKLREGDLGYKSSVPKKIVTHEQKE